MDGSPTTRGACAMDINAATRPVGPTMPHMTPEVDDADGNSAAFQVAVAPHMQASGCIAVGLVFMTANFSAMWANPIWIWEPSSTYRNRVISLVKRATNVTPWTMFTALLTGPEL